MPKATKGTVVPNPFPMVRIDTVDREALFGGLTSAGHTLEYARVQADTLPSTDGALQMLARHRLQAAEGLSRNNKLGAAVQHLLNVGEFCRTDETESALRKVRAALSTTAEAPTPYHIGAAFHDAPYMFKPAEVERVDTSGYAEALDTIDAAPASPASAFLRCYEHEIRDPDCPICASETDPSLINTCRASLDGECGWSGCPQLRDKEPQATGRHCPLDVGCARCRRADDDCRC